MPPGPTGFGLTFLLLRGLNWEVSLYFYTHPGFRRLPTRSFWRGLPRFYSQLRLGAVSGRGHERPNCWLGGLRYLYDQFLLGMFSTHRSSYSSSELTASWQLALGLFEQKPLLLGAPRPKTVVSKARLSPRNAWFQRIDREHLSTLQAPLHSALHGSLLEERDMTALQP